ncbi:MAG: EAL domain-containing protein [Janthinobacterium lividum]
MLKVLNCIAYEHDLRLVALSAVVCILGCLTTTTLLARAVHARDGQGLWLLCAAAVFGCSIWSLHFVAMLAFRPGQEMSYDIELTLLSVVVACGGSFAALLAWKLPISRPASVTAGAILLGFAISGMHYVGVAAVTFSGFLIFNRPYVAASVVVSVVFSTLALGRAHDLRTAGRRFEVGAWLALAICGLHFIGMTAITLAPGVALPSDGEVLDTRTLAVAVAGVSVAILIASLIAVMLEQHMSQRVLKDLDRMRLLNNLAQEVILIQRDGFVCEVNSAGERLFKARAGDIVGSPLRGLFAADSVPILVRREMCSPLLRRPEEMEVRAADGTYVKVEVSCQPIDYLGKPATAIALRDLTDSKRDEARTRHLARHDSLTDLPNRYNLQERLEVALDIAAQRGATLVLVNIDLDRFKPVNDLFGHAVGDALLIQVSKRILAEIRPTDTLARVGGDEFVMVLTSQPQPDTAWTICTRVIDALRKPFQIEGHQIEIGASMGIALYPDDGRSGDVLMRAADAAMYRVKEEGRGALRFYEASMNDHLQARLQLKRELAKAVEADDLVLHYQPIVNGVTGEVEAFEALLRWDHPQHGMISPADFVPLAEESGLIDAIGRWVIDTTIREAASWPHLWPVAINVSPRQFRFTDVCAVLGRALATHKLDPSRVVVEVTEGILVDDAEKAVVILNRLRGMGICIALDDFGTGYSSLSYLQLFKFDKLKIDKSFVAKLRQDGDALTIIRAVINLGHNLGLKVTAEGVETQAQLDALRMLGCDQLQGFLVGRPAPSGDFTELDRLRTKALFGRERSRLSA